MFNNIIYFIVVLLIFNVGYTDTAPERGPWVSVLLMGVCWGAFALYCRWGFRGLVRRFLGGGEGTLGGAYQGLTVRLSILAIFLFAMDVLLLNLKSWLRVIPLFDHSSLLQGLAGLGIFFFYLCTVWYHAYPVYDRIYRTGISRSSFIRSNLRFNIPILFPWGALSLIFDLVSLFPRSGLAGFLDRVEGQILFFAGFLSLLMLVMPRFIQAFWGCEPLGVTGKAGELVSFLRERGFRYRGLLRWPVFEGRLLTAGIMGIVPRYRYVLVTDALLEALTVDELKAVLAHEMGHARYRHMLFYLLFFVGYLVLSFGLFDLFFYGLASRPLFLRMLTTGNPSDADLFYLVLSVPMLLSLLVYFRVVMGFFMRNFERQADLYSARVMGTPLYTIAALEKIAYLSGKSREVPSWHHFSIAQRVATLWKSAQDPRLAGRHTRRVFASFIVYLVCICSMAYLLNFGPVKKGAVRAYLGGVLERQAQLQPRNLELRMSLAMLYYRAGEHDKAIKAYEKILERDPRKAEALNNLAWLLVTCPEKGLRDPARGLELARRAVALERSPVYLDTLAEACFVNGLVEEALALGREALEKARDNRAYYEEQLRKFRSGAAS